MKELEKTKKQKKVFTDYKTCKFIVKSVKTYTFPKKN